MHIWQIDPVNITPYYDLALCEALVKAGHEVRFITSKYLYDPALVYPKDINVDLQYFKLLEHPLLLRLPFARKILRGLLYPLGHIQLIAQIWRHRPDIVHIQWSRLPAFDRWLAAAIKRMGIPLVHTVHDVEPLFTYGLFSGRLEDVYAYVDAFIVHTEENRVRFLKHFSTVNPNSVRIIPMIANNDPLIPVAATQALARQALNIDPTAFIVLSFGAVKNYKGLDVLGKAIPLLGDADSNIQFWIVGRPETDQDAELLEKLRQLDRVHVHAEYVPSDQVWQYHLAADVLVFPYREITQSAALVTALNYGRAVIVTDVGGMPDMIKGNGWIVPAEDPQALATALREAVNNRERLQEMGNQSLKIIAEVNAPAVVAEQFIRLYEQIIAS